MTLKKIRRFKLRREFAENVRKGGVFNLGGYRVPVYQVTRHDEIIEGDLYAYLSPDILAEIAPRYVDVDDSGNESPVDDVKALESKASEPVVEPKVEKVVVEAIPTPPTPEPAPADDTDILDFLEDGEDEEDGEDDSKSLQSSHSYVPSNLEELEKMTTKELKLLTQELEVYDKVKTAESGHRSKGAYIEVLSDELFGK